MEKKQVIQYLTDLMATIQAAYYKGRLHKCPLRVHERDDADAAISIDLYDFDGDGHDFVEGLHGVMPDHSAQGVEEKLSGYVFKVSYDPDDEEPLFFAFSPDDGGEDYSILPATLPTALLERVAAWLRQMLPMPSKKTAFLVSFCPMTRVVIEAADPDNLTDEEQDQLVRLAREQIVKDAVWKLNGENIDEVRPDDECPYGTYPDEEQPRIAQN